MKNFDKVGALSQISMFASLPAEDIQRLANMSSMREVSRFQFVYLPDEAADHIYIIAAGCIKIGTFAHDGREVIKEILKPIQFFGDGALAGEMHRSEFAQVQYEDAVLMAIPMDSIRQLMQTQQRFMFACLQNISARLQKMEDRLARLILKDARERIIEFLVESAARDGRKVGYETLVKHHLTQQDIANITGTSRQTVTTVFNSLRKLNLIHFTRSSILIRDVTKLA